MKMPVSPFISPPAPPVELSHIFNQGGGWYYQQEETGLRFHTKGINAMQQKVYVHRVGMNLDTSVGWEIRLQEELCEQMTWLNCQEVPRPEDHPTVVNGRKHWKLLHDYALSYPDEPTIHDIHAAHAWFVNWTNGIPQYGCPCKRRFNDIVINRPIVLTSRSAFYQWSVDVHNDVNVKLGKPVWTPEDPAP